MININEIQRKYGFNFKDSLGQNFFNNNVLLDEIVCSLNISKDDLIIEIGPGFGVLTEKLLILGKKVISIEIDDRVIPILLEELKGFGNFELIHKDFMKLDLNNLGIGKERVKVVANIPYYITTPILEKLFKSNLNIDFIAIMMQKEVGDRILANNSSKEYGSLSIFCDYFSTPSLVKRISSSNFTPRPKVDSVIIRFDIKSDREFNNKEIEDKFLSFVKKCFNMRRKTLFNALSQFNKSKDELSYISKLLNIDFKKRAENLTTGEFISIFKILSKSI